MWAAGFEVGLRQAGGVIQRDGGFILFLASTECVCTIKRLCAFGSSVYGSSLGGVGEPRCCCLLSQNGTGWRCSSFLGFPWAKCSGKLTKNRPPIFFCLFNYETKRLFQPLSFRNV